MVWLPTKPDPPVTRIVLITISLLDWMRGVRQESQFFADAILSFLGRELFVCGGQSR